MKKPKPTKTLTLGANLRALRKSCGVTIKDLSKRMDRPSSWLSQVERDLAMPSIDDLRHISQALGVPVSVSGDQMKQRKTG